MINRNRLRDEFCKLVSIDSVSYRERQMADELTGLLRELGFQVEEDRAGEHCGGNCGNLYGILKGELAGEPILLSAHMDTVEPGTRKKAVVHEDGRISSDGTTVLGADDISGLVAILEAVRTVKEQGLAHRSIEVLFPIAEEVYILGSGLFDYSRVKAKEAYVLDLTGPVGTAAIQAPTLISFTASIKGKAAHAGFAPEEGINAIAIAAEAIGRIKQGRIDPQTTVNIGLIEGGLARNIVSDLCTLKGEVRSLSHDSCLAEAAKLEQVLRDTAGSRGAVCEYEASFGCYAYEIKPEHPVVRRFVRACRSLDIEVSLIPTFGGSDNNNFVRNGISGIVLACGMNQVHSCQEYTTVDELARCTEILIKLITDRN
jgi:tripeptide aminopeptidase